MNKKGDISLLPPPPPPSNVKVSQQELTSAVLKVRIAQMSSFCDNRIEIGQCDPHMPAHETEQARKNVHF